MANITFRNAQQAKVAVTKFNGAPIDGGRSRLVLNLIVDPNQAPASSLVGRIQPLPTKKIITPQTNTKRNPRAPNKKAAAVKNNRKQKKERPAKKSLEDLDKEMADYFEKK